MTIAPSAAATAASGGWTATASNPVIWGITLNGLTAATNYNFNLVGALARDRPSKIKASWPEHLPLPIRPSCYWTRMHPLTAPPGRST